MHSQASPPTWLLLRRVALLLVLLLPRLLVLLLLLRCRRRRHAWLLLLLQALHIWGPERKRAACRGPQQLARRELRGKAAVWHPVGSQAAPLHGVPAAVCYMHVGSPHFPRPPLPARRTLRQAGTPAWPGNRATSAPLSTLHALMERSALPLSTNWASGVRHASSACPPSPTPGLTICGRWLGGGGERLVSGLAAPAAAAVAGRRLFLTRLHKHHAGPSA